MDRRFRFKGFIWNSFMELDVEQYEIDKEGVYGFFFDKLKRLYL